MKKNKQKNNLSYQPGQILQRFKSLVNSGLWIEALNTYRNWLNRTGNKVNSRIETELLFRSAEILYKKNELEKAIRFLNEAANKDPQDPGRYHRLMAVCFARLGNPIKSLEIFKSLKDDFHQKTMSYIIERKIALPGTQFAASASIEKSIILDLWNKIVNASISKNTDIILNNIKNILKPYVRGSDDQPFLFKHINIFSSLAEEFSLVSDIYKRRNEEIKKSIDKDPDMYKDPFYSELLRIHLSLLLKEEKYNEIIQLCRIFEDKGIDLSYTAEFSNESLFFLGLEEIKKENYEKALANFSRITEDIPAVIHNAGLCCQKLEMYSEANDYWKKLLRYEKKPKRADPENLIEAYTATLKYIGQNYMEEKDLEEAYKYYKEILDYYKDDKLALESLVEICIKSQSYSEVSQYSKRLYDLEPENIEYTIIYLGELMTSGQYDSTIAICKKVLDLNPENSFFKMFLADSYIEKAWKYRKANPSESRELLKEVEGHGIKNPKKLYIEGFFLMEAGKIKNAQNKFNAAVKYELSHKEQYDLGLAFYEDNMIPKSIKMFKNIASCGCSMSYEYIEDSIKYLASKNDYKSVRELCDYAYKDADFHLRDISGILYDNNKYSWAKEYSSLLINESCADDEDEYLHLLILNSCGQREDTLKYAQ